MLGWILVSDILISHPPPVSPAPPAPPYHPPLPSSLSQAWQMVKILTLKTLICERSQAVKS